MESDPLRFKSDFIFFVVLKLYAFGPVAANSVIVIIYVMLVRQLTEI